MTRLILAALCILALLLFLAWARPSPVSSGGAVYEFEVNLS